MKLSTVFALVTALTSVALAQVDAPVSNDGAPPEEVRLYDAPRRVAPLAPAALPPSTGFLSLNQDPEGDMPRAAAFTPDGQRVVVVNRDTDTVTIFDFATRQIVATIGVGDFPVDVAVAPDGSVAVVPNVLSNTVSIIDLGSLAVAATVPVTATNGGQPYSVAIDDASSLCLVGIIEDATTSRFSVIDLGTNAETFTFSTSSQGAFGFFGTPEPGIFGNLYTDWALSGDGSFVLLPDRGGDVLNSYDVATGALLGSSAVGDVPSFVDISGDGSKAVVSLAGTTDAVVEIALVGGVPSIVGTTPTNNSASTPQVRITPDGTEAVVAVLNAVEFIDLASTTSVATVNTGSVGDLEFTFDDQFLVVTNFTTRVISLATRTVVDSMSFAATADATISPVSHRLVGLNNRFREDLHFYTTNGASSQFLGRALSGEEPEVDAPRRVEITPDGTRALVVTNTSRSVADIDLATGATLATYGIGDRGWEVATDAAGDVAVATSTESSEVAVIDLVQRQVVATLPVPERPTEVAVAPDGSAAYVTTVAGTDRLWFIDLAGAVSTVSGSIIAGQLGTIGWASGQSSGLELSPDGNTLALCVSFEDRVRLIDVGTRTQLASIPVGDFPIRARWADDGSALYVSNAFSDTVSRIAFSGATSSVTATANGVLDGFGIDTDGDFVYVGEYGFGSDRLAVLDETTMARVATVPLPGRPSFQERVGDQLFIAAGDRVARVRLDGTSTVLVESILITASPYDLAFSGARGVAVTTQPGANDGVDLTRFGGTPANGCGPAVPNSTGRPATISAAGSFLAGGLPLQLTASDLPSFSFGYFISSTTTGFSTNPSSQGILCLGGTIGRFLDQVQSSGSAGVISIAVDTLSLPSVPTSVAILPGETWSFQLWFRDANPNITSNFTDRVTVTFE